MSFPHPCERPDLWPWALRPIEGVDVSVADPEVFTLAGHSLASLPVSEPVFMAVDVQDVHGQANVCATAFAEEFWDGYGLSGSSVVYRGWALGYQQLVRVLADYGVVFLCSTGEELRGVLGAGVSWDALRVEVNELTVPVCEQFIVDGQASGVGQAVFVLSAECVPLWMRSPLGSVGARVVADLRGVCGVGSDEAGVVSCVSQGAGEVVAEFSGVELAGVFVGLNVGDCELDGVELALRGVVESLRVVGGELLMLDVVCPLEAVDVQPSMVAQARALADGVRVVCGSSGSVPRVDVVLTPACVDHGVCVVDRGAGHFESLLSASLSDVRVWELPVVLVDSQGVSTASESLI